MVEFGVPTKKLMKGLKAGVAHIQVWVLLFLINFWVFKDIGFELELKYKIYTWFLYVVVFYISYLFLFKYFFLKKKYFLFSIITACLVIVSTFFLREIRQASMNKYFETHKFMVADPAFDSLFHRGDKILSKPPPGEERYSENDNRFGIMTPDSLKLEQRKLPGRPPLHKDFFSLYSVILVLTASVSVKFFEEWQENEKRKSEMESEKLATELTYLKHQINPHFLFNSLNSIYSLSMSKSENTADAIIKLSSILRYILYRPGNIKVFLTEELKILVDYIDLQKLRLTDKVDLNYKIVGDSGNYEIEPFILIPLIENAFKYGADNVNDTFIDILISINENVLTLLVRNTNLSKSIKKEESSGIGIQNIIRRLDLIYPNAYKLKLDDMDDVFVVKLEINL
ncbi:MAG: sensor histidine kinase [Bacteroidales bacterium]|nr:sensor histidine kinase [Bacteroidales bacterium]MBN2820123.1 sensor histidine kinase [Bacteroidales bacterium]